MDCFQQNAFKHPNTSVTTTPKMNEINGTFLRASADFKQMKKKKLYCIHVTIIDIINSSGQKTITINYIQNKGF